MFVPFKMTLLGEELDCVGFTESSDVEIKEDDSYTKIIDKNNIKQ